MNRTSKFKTIIIITILSLFASALSYAMVMEGVKTDKAEYDPHAIIVKFKPHTISLPLGGRTVSLNEASISAASINALNEKFKVSKLRKIFETAQEGVTVKLNKHGEYKRVPDLSGYYKIYLPDEVNVAQALDEYKKDPNIEIAGFDYIAHVMVLPADTDFPDQWGLSNEGQSGGTPGDDIDAERAWGVCKGTNEAVIAIVDSGVDTDHPDLSSKLVIINGCNKTSQGGPNDPNPVPITPYSGVVEHGTHCSGIAAAITDNAVAGASGGSVAGVAWNCKIMPVKVIKNNNIGDYVDVAAGIVFAADNGADVISLSLGGTYDTTIMQPAIDYAYAKDCVIVAAAGNDNMDISSGGSKQSPVCNDGSENEVVGVAGTNHNDIKAWYSNYSPTYVDVSAPGGETTVYSYRGIYSSVFYDGGTYSSYYKYFQGTSMATPFVSGLAALIRSQHPEFNNSTVLEVLKRTTDYIGYYSNPGDMGSGRINAYNALSASNLCYILSPAQGSAVLGIVTINGTATWEGSGFFRLSVGSGPSPSTWEELSYSTSPIVNSFIANWDTTGLGGTFTLRLIVNDLSSLESNVVVNVGTGRAKIIGDVISGPNPFNPHVDPRYVFYYKLSENAETTISIFDLQGSLLWKKIFLAGSEGGKSGQNKPEWDGRSNFSGGYLANGVYLYQVVARGTVIGRGKILIFK